MTISIVLKMKKMRSRDLSDLSRVTKPVKDRIWIQLQSLILFLCKDTSFSKFGWLTTQEITFLG